MERIKLDLVPSCIKPVLHASQYDDGRQWTCDILNGGTPYVFQSGDTVDYTIRKGDGLLVTGAVAVTPGTSYIILVSTEQMCAVFGSNLGELTITSNGTKVGSVNFILEVERAPDENGITSQSEIKNLERQVHDIVVEELEDNGAEETGYDNTESGLEATNVQDAIDEVNTKIENIPSVDAYTKEETDEKFATKTELETLEGVVDDKTDRAEFSELQNTLGFTDIKTLPQFTATSGKQVNPTGNLGNSENWSYSSFIELGDTERVSVNFSNNNQYVSKITFYRRRSNTVDYTSYYFVSAITDVVADQEYKVPTGDIKADYVVLCYLNADFPSTLPVVTLHKNEYETVIKADEVGIIQEASDVKNRVFASYNKVSGKQINANGSEGTNASWSHSVMLPVINATHISVNFSNDSQYVGKIAFYKEIDDIALINTYYVIGTPITDCEKDKKYEIPVVDGVRATYFVVCYPNADFPNTLPVVTLYGDAYSETLKKTDILFGKKWFCCGDSYSAGDYSTSQDEYLFPAGRFKGRKKVYSRFIADRHNMDLRLCAKNGATLGMRNDDSYYSDLDYDPLTTQPSNTNNFFWSQLQRIESDADYITLWFGINDSGYCDLGTINDNDVKSFYGALNWSFQQLLTRFPLAHIGVVVSYRCNNSYQQAVRECAQKWAIPYLDTVGDVKIPTISGARDNQTIPSDASLPTIRYDNNFRVSATNGHPNQKAHEYESTFIENWLKSL